jgi:hypothetical protein
MDATSTNAQIGTIAIGKSALGALTSGSGNTAVGYQSLDATTTGAANTMVGYQTGTALVAGSDGNTAVGYQALLGGNNDVTHENTVVGYQAGQQISTGFNNTLIGANVDVNTGSFDNVVAIGNNFEATQDDTVFLGNNDTEEVWMALDKGATVYCAGVNFPDTQVASADANTLDDYEEGSWTIAVTCATSGTYTLNSSYDRGEYTKIGRVVHAQGYGSISSNSSPTGDTRISLPFAAADLTEYAGHTGGSITVLGGMNFTGNFFTMEISEGAQYFRIVEITDGSAPDYVDDAELSAGDFFFNVTYIAA